MANLEQFEFRVERQADAQDVVLVCRVCGQTVVGALDDGVGKGDPRDNTLDVLVFLATDHASLYCGSDR